MHIGMSLFACEPLRLIHLCSVTSPRQVKTTSRVSDVGLRYCSLTCAYRICGMKWNI